MASDIVITPNRGSTSVNAKIDFTGASTASSQIRLEVLPDNSLSFVGTTGSLFSIADSVTGSLMSVNDASGLPILEVFDTDKVVMGQYNQNTLVVNGTKVGIGTASPTDKLTIAGVSNNGITFTGSNATLTSNTNLIGVAGTNIYLRPGSGYTVTVDTGNGLYVTSGESRALLFRDAVDTGYYVDPGSTSNLNGLTVAGTITGSISGNAATATTATTATNWGTYGAVPAAGTSFGTANTIGRSDANGYAYFYYINSSTSNNENGTVSQFVITNGSDNFYRKASLSHVKSQMGLSASDNPQFNSIGLAIAASGTAGSISLNQSGTRSWSITPTGGNLAFASGDGSGALTYNSNIILHAGNYNSYAPTLTGTGASGTWGISISGNAATATSADQIDGVPFRNSISSGPVNADNLDSNGITYYTSGVTNFSGNSTDGALYSQAYSSSWQHQIAGDYRSGQIALRGKNSGTWQSWRTVLDSSNYTSYVGNGTLTLNTSGNGISGSTSFTANQSGAGTFTVISNATVNNTANTIMYRGGSGEVYVGDVYSSQWFRNYGTAGLYNQDYGNHWYATGNDYWNLAGNNASNIGIILRSGGHQGTIRGYVYADSNNHIGFLNNGGSWRLRVVSGDYTLADGSSIRGQLFYDSNDTNYYIDPASTGTSANFAGNIIVANGRTDAYIYMGDTDEGQRVIHNNSNRIGFLNQSSGWGAWCDDSGYWQSDTSIRGPLFYDSNDTNYYCDPASTSTLKNITNVYYAKNGVYNNLGNPTVDEKALFHGQFNNKFRFWAPQTQEESTNGTTWTTSTRASAQQLLDLMLGEGQGTSFTAIPAPGTGNAGYYRLTWDATIAGSPAYCFLDAVYCYNSTNGNNVTFTVEAQDSGTSSWSTIATGTISNWPGHTYIPHSSLPYVANSTSGYYKKVRLTFAITSAAAYGTGLQIYGIEWWGGYPQGRRNVEYFDSNRNVFWPAKVYGTQFVDSDSTTYYLDPASSSYLNLIRGNNWLYLDQNYGHSVVGLYNSTRYQGVFAMGDSYKLPADGTTTGSLYGIAWSHPNAGGVAANLNTHGALVMENGTFLAAISGSIRCRDDMRAPRFYDSGDTNYYCDPASTSVFSGLTIAGNTAIHAGNYSSYAIARAGDTVSGAILFNSNKGSGVYLGSTNSPPLQVWSNDGGTAFMSFHRSGAYAVNMGLDPDNVFRIGGWSASAGRLTLNMSGDLWTASSMRSSAFYDQDDTNYVVDPASTSRVNTISFVSGATFGPYLQYNNQSNLRLQAGQQSGAIGISGYDFNGNWKFQLYGDSSGYGFLNGNWAGWDLLKSVSGNLYLNNQSTYYIGTNEIYYNRVYGVTDIRSPIFYDNNDTAYYIDPTSGQANSEGGKIKWNFTVNGEGAGGGRGLALYPSYTSSVPTYGITFAQTASLGTHGNVTSDWATYFTMNSTANRGWVFRVVDGTPANVASINNAGRMRIASLGVNTDASATNGEIRATDNITAYYSDERLKTKLGAIENPIEKVKSLSGFYFEANETAIALGYQKKREVGVSAQEVQAILPEIIAPAPIDEQYMTVRYEKLIPLLIEAIKEQQKQIEELKSLLSNNK